MAESQLITHGLPAEISFSAEGGAGYVQVGRQGGVFGDHVSTAITADDSLIVIFGSRNDTRSPIGQMAHATCETMRRAEIAAPSAQLLVIGPAWNDGNPPRSILQARDIIYDRTLSLGGQFIDPLADNWFVDDPSLIGSDNVHPTDAGHLYMAERIWPVMQKMLGQETQH